AHTHQCSLPLLQLSTGGGQHCEETQTPEFLSVEAGKSVSISCTGTSGIGDNMSWYLQKPGEAPKLLIYRASNRQTGVLERFSGSYSGLNFQLSISGVQAEDAGDYYCMGFYSGGRRTQ
uniref:Ig-like domain-containing protein n=1 Tax=Astyanax mexicanus TaxID=7994 RepID=W5KHC3_ASTMX